MRRQGEKLKRVLLAVRGYFIFFALLCFVITCCMVLFLETLSSVNGIELSGDQISQAATVTFINVIFLSLIFTVIDALRRRFLVDRQIKKIVDATKKVMAGDFSVRIEQIRGGSSAQGLNEVIVGINEMTQELSKMESLRSDFISNVSHELKTPLAVIQNYCTLLSDRSLPEQKQKEYLSAISSSSRRLAGMITNILRLNKLENQTVYPDVKTFDLGEQICECILEFEDAIDEKGLELETELEEDVSVTADPQLLELVWNNLLSNAIKFTDSGGTVTVTLKSDGDSASVSVRDTGCGIGADEGKHIFEKFYQGDTSHSTQGNGLGLALVKRVVNILHASIEVSSELGKGSVFTVKLHRGKYEQD